MGWKGNNWEDLGAKPTSGAQRLRAYRAAPKSSSRGCRDNLTTEPIGSEDYLRFADHSSRTSFSKPTTISVSEALNLGPEVSALDAGLRIAFNINGSRERLSPVQPSRFFQPRALP